MCRTRVATTNGRRSLLRLLLSSSLRKSHYPFRGRDAKGREGRKAGERKGERERKLGQHSTHTHTFRPQHPSLSPVESSLSFGSLLDWPSLSVMGGANPHPRMLSFSSSHLSTERETRVNAGALDDDVPSSSPAAARRSSIVWGLP